MKGVLALAVRQYPKIIAATHIRAFCEANETGLAGFERTGNFSEFFRRHTGMTPRAYREAKREGSPPTAGPAREN